MALEEPQPPKSDASSEWVDAENARRENAAEMEGVDGVAEMMARRALPEPSGEE